jgi:hypothetical protein
VADQLAGSGLPLGMAVATEPHQRDRYLAMGVTLFQENIRS